MDDQTVPTATWRPRVTALMPCYNAAEFIQASLDSLAAQTWPDLEILIADDRSTDGTLEIVRSFAEGRSNVRVLVREKNLGWLGNSNRLMSEATGEAMFFAFHDDLVAPTYVEALVGALRDRPQAIMAFSDLELLDLDGSSKVLSYPEITLARSPADRAVEMWKPGNWWVPNRGLFRAEAFRRIGGIRPSAAGEYCADWTWLLEMALIGEFVRVPEVLCRKIYRKGSISKTWPHSRRQRVALKIAGVKAIFRSDLPPASKAVLLARASLLRVRRMPSALAARVRRRLAASR